MTVDHGAEHLNVPVTAKKIFDSTPPTTANHQHQTITGAYLHSHRQNKKPPRFPKRPLFEPAFPFNH
jgi:hypothetical protein